MTVRSPLRPGILFPLIASLGCATVPRPPADSLNLVSPVLESRHQGSDDLLTAGLGLVGLRLPMPPLAADPAAPTAAELRRQAIHSNWRGIADLSPGGGYGDLYGDLAAVPGREFQALAQLPGASQPFRVLLQVPDDFDAERRCLLVAPASGSRGVYGAIALAGGYGLPRGCAVVYTDKGAGTGYFDHASDTGVALDGRRARRGDAQLEFEPAPLGPEAPPLVSMKHAHSGDHPEADWGQHVLLAARFGLALMEQARPDLAPFRPDNTRVIAAAVSNGAVAVLRAAEQDDQGLLSALLAAAPNITPPAGSALFDYALQAALLQPCLLAEPDAADWPFASLMPRRVEAGLQRCRSLHAAGLLSRPEPSAAREQLRAAGWDDAALRLSAINVQFDLWRAVTVSYASAYLRRAADKMPCGFALAVLDSQGRPRPASAAEQASWWSTTAGIGPIGSIGLISSQTDADDPALPGLLCLRALAEDPALIAATDAVRGSARLAEIPALILHGAADGLVPASFSARPYVAAARANGSQRLAYWEIERAQHFDAFLGFPDLGREYLPLLPYVHAGLDALLAHLESGAPAPADRRIEPRSRGLVDGAMAPLTREHLGL